METEMQVVQGLTGRKELEARVSQTAGQVEEVTALAAEVSYPFSAMQALLCSSDNRGGIK